MTIKDRTLILRNSESHPYAIIRYNQVVYVQISMNAILITRGQTIGRQQPYCLTPLAPEQIDSDKQP